MYRLYLGFAGGDGTGSKQITTARLDVLPMLLLEYLHEDRWPFSG
jgi:hypothetical protein